MGQDKALLPFGPEPMISRVVRVLAEAVSPIVVVAAPGQVLPELTVAAEIVYDRHLHQGPLEGLACGLEAFGQQVDSVYLTGCDVPLLRPEFVRRVVELRGNHEAATPWIKGNANPLAAVYDRSVSAVATSLLEAGERAPRLIFEMIRTRRISREELIDVDPDLQSLLNVNNPDAYHAALKLAGF